MAIDSGATQSPGGGLRRNALFRLTVMAASLLAWLIAFGGLVMPSLRKLGDPGSLAGDGARLVGAVVSAAVTLLLYRLLVRKVEQREPVEISSSPGVRLGLLGSAFGLALFCAVVGLMWLAGAAQFSGLGTTTRLFPSLAAAMMASIGEELVFRGVLFRIIEQATGTLTALLLSSLFFGLAHLANPDVTIVTALAIAIEAGLLLGLAFVATRNLWFPIGVHFAWNFVQASIFAASGSGAGSDGLVKVQYVGPEWLTGGAFGPEASVVAVILCLAAALAFALVVRRRGEWKSARFRLRLD